MTFDDRLLVVLGSAYAVTAGLCSILLPPIWRYRPPNRLSATYADDLLRLRWAPAAAGAIAVLCSVIAFMRFEPRTNDETMGLLLLAMAYAAPALALVSASRLVSSWWLTHRTMRRWMKTARPVTLEGVHVPALVVDTAFPIVAVVGIFRPRLVVAEKVLTHCSAAELAAIFAHERAHILRRDNLRQVLLQAPPDPLLWSGSMRDMREAWHDATEQAADDATARESDVSRLNLADALVHVARLAPPRMRFDLPASALYRGEPLEQRIRRLLDDERPSAPATRFRVWQIALLLTLLFAGLSSLSAIQRLVEAAVRRLP